MLRGVYTALVTPFNADGSVDYERFKALVQRQIDLGIDGLVPIGTTGESPTLTDAEKDRLIKITVDVANGELPVIAGTGSNCTATSIDATKRAKDNGADYSLQVTPYYNKPSQEGLDRHFTEIADQGGLPLVIYNVPGRSSVNITVETLLRLAKHPGIVAVKEACGSITQIMDLMAQCPADFSVLAGDDAFTLPMISLGAHGVISVASNMFVSEMSRLVHEALDGNYERALEEHNKLYPFFVNEFIEVNPVPIKTYMADAGLLEETVRLPLAPLVAKNKEILLNTYK
ncbi:MAG: 4-hydroxy-tetrahydrodipicolinate synthase [Spirochaetales bacterium]|nr:4-hydroxy-tetrahydrodipicolinate synthase [Spirochaetales bacterium]